jgi:uncharacterized protein
MPLARRSRFQIINPSSESSCMGRGGRPRKHDPIADSISRHIGNGEDSLAQSLIEVRGTELPDGEARTALIWAAAHNRVDLLKWLIDRQANINHQDRIGYCGLHFAAQNKFCDVARTLLESGASTELRDIHGNTPLWTAAFSARGDYGVVQLLLSYGASLDNVNNVGKTPRDVATMFFPDRLHELVSNA